MKTCLRNERYKNSAIEIEIINHDALKRAHFTKNRDMTERSTTPNKITTRSAKKRLDDRNSQQRSETGTIDSPATSDLVK